MYEPQHHRHDSPPEYSPPAYGPPVYSAPYSAVPQHSSYHHVPYRCGPNAGFKEPQHFYRCLSPPVLVRTFKGITALMCFIIVALVASTLMWESSGYWGGYMEGSYGTFYTGTYNSYTSPMAAKTAMMVVSGVNFILSLAILIWSCSQTRISRGCRFYLGVFICDIILAVLQVSPGAPRPLGFRMCGFIWSLASRHSSSEVIEEILRIEGVGCVDQLQDYS